VNDPRDVIVDDLSALRRLVSNAPDAANLRAIGLGEVVRGNGAITSLPDVLQRLGVTSASPVTVLCDTTPMRYDGDDHVLDVVTKTLSPYARVEVVQIVPDAMIGAVLADEATVAAAVERVRRSAPTALVSVGSGTVVDIAKFVARELSLMHVVVQTAASVNGYADDQSVLLINGAKRTTPSRWPDVLVIDPLVVAYAPLAMTRSGFGDALSMFSAAADWYLASAVGFDPSYSPTVVTLMRRHNDDLLSRCREIGQGDPEAVSALSTSLTLGGVAMGVAGRTSPSSGTEHVIGHLLEMRADASRVPSASHGSQVGAASVLASIVWRRVRQRLTDGNVNVIESNLATRDRVFDAFSSLDTSTRVAAECWSAYERKSQWIREHLDAIRLAVAQWPLHESAIDLLVRPPEFVASALRDAQAPVTFSQLSPAPDYQTVEWAIANCHLMRDRFCVVDLADLLGWWQPEDRLATLGELYELAR